VLNRVLLIWQTLFSHYRQHPAQGLFLTIGLSLGVAILLGTLIVSDAAKTSFMAGQKVVGGRVVATIIPLNGRTTFAETVYVKLRKNGFTELIPTVEGRVRLKNGQFLAVQGIDAFALMHNTSNPTSNATSRSSSANEDKHYPHSAALNPLTFSFPPYQLLIAKTFADKLNVTPGSTPALADGANLPAVSIVSDDFGIGYSALCDIRCTQALTSLPNQLTSIALTALPTRHLGDDHSTDPLERLKALLPPEVGLSLVTKNAANHALSEAFFLNMTAVSFLAFLVGCFIAFNAVRFSVLQRLNMVRNLRLAGATFSEVALALVLELLFWALLASIIGGLLGWFLAQLLLPGVGLTLVQLFQGINILTMGGIEHWWSLALLISLLATITATVQPFWQLAQQKPLQTNVNTDSPSHVSGVVLAISLLLIGGGLTLLPQSQALGFAITACWFMGGALLVPGVLLLLYHRLSQIKGLLNYPKLHWAITDGQFNHARLSVAMMAFTVAIAAGIGVSTMVSSFRITLIDYLDQSFSESLYLIPSQADTLPIKQYLDQHPDVLLAYRYLHTSTTLRGRADEFQSQIRSMSNHQIRHDSTSLEQQVDGLWAKFHQQQGVIINQTLAFQQQLSPGDSITLQRPHQSITTQVLGVYYSYGSTNAAMAIDESWLKTLWPQLNTVEVGVYLKKGLNKDLKGQGTVDELLLALKDKFQLQSHHYLKPQELKGLALTIFEQTFHATNLLTVFTLMIAAIGIYCACYAAEVDKQRQLTLLKVLGVNNREIALLSLLQLFFNALVAALIALPLGLLIAWASVHIVLQYSFGWHFAVVIQPLVLTAILGGAILIALLAGLIPLYRLSQKTVINAFREAV
jgi:putative ABC transport system permease protein